jgi:geranylgeranyl pyrophosphate synthase
MTTSPSIFSLDDWASAHRAALQPRLLAPFADAFPARFAEACAYPLETGGKRVRPLLVLAAAEAVGLPAPTEAVWAAAVAVELVHTYSLVHDDLPAMDDDDLRRGRPSVHKAYDEATAILVGDALLTEAFGVLVRAPGPSAALVHSLVDAAGHRGMVGGQALDIGLDGAASDAAALTRVHRAKTGALIHAACTMGAAAAGATEAQQAALSTYGHAVGLAFQLADDVLDEDEDAGEDGPPSYVRLLGRDETLRRAREELARALDAVAPLPHPAALVSLARFIVERDH